MLEGLHLSHVNVSPNHLSAPPFVCWRPAAWAGKPAPNRSSVRKSAANAEGTTFGLEGSRFESGLREHDAR
jgi:hypothetical protein